VIHCTPAKIRALQPTLAGKSFGDIDLVGGQDIHTKEAVTLE
jgi:hypothetical protein